MTKNFTLIILSCLLQSFCHGETNVKSCQTIGSRNFMFTNNLKTCVLSRREKSDQEFKILDEIETVKAIDFQRNRNIEVLPIEVDKNFPNLILFNAASCSIKIISKKNFVNLVKLEEINLKDCRIEKINGDTFEDQISLKRLLLSGNIIKHINVDFIAGMTQINNLSLKNNTCVDHNLYNHNSITNYLKTITEKCGFVEESVL